MLITNQTMLTHANNEKYSATFITTLDKDNIGHNLDCRSSPKCVCPSPFTVCTPLERISLLKGFSTTNLKDEIGSFKFQTCQFKGNKS
jgi:hypothetical protein